MAITPAFIISSLDYPSLTALNDDDNSFSTWESHSGKFAFGFQKIKKNNKSGFLLAIWFNKTPERTIVWSANGDNLVQQNSKVELNTSGLFLKDPKGNQIWKAHINEKTTSFEVYYAAMLDTGNFVVANNDSVHLWESFHEPTDTLLPTQTLTQGTKLVARYSYTNYSPGRFQFTLQEDGNLVLSTTKFPLQTKNYPYWESHKVGNGGIRLIFNQSGFIYLEEKYGSMLIINTNSSSRQGDDDDQVLYQRVVLEYNGVLRHYVYYNNESNSSVTLLPQNICVDITDQDGPGACGFNSYCSLGDDRRPKCGCPNGYTLINSNDESRGCKRSFEAQSCGGEAVEYENENDDNGFEFISMENTFWPKSNYDHFQQVNEEWCKKVACLGDCFCAVAYFKNGECWKLKVPLVNGRRDPIVGGKAHIKIRKDSTSNGKVLEKNKHDNNDSKLILIGSVFLSGSVFMNVLLLATCFVIFRFKQKTKAIVPPKFEAIKGKSLRSFSYEELEKATNKFSEQLGSGAFGTVFKGVISINGYSNCIAIKKLDKIDMAREASGEQEFKAEVSAIGRTNHKNLVQLIGLCNEGQHRLLVYEFMSNGSLASFVFRPSPRPSWHHRTQIGLDIAMGLCYLHEECSTQIIHCDIKPQNILLDDSFTARISDFGLAKILTKNQTQTKTGIRGSRGYVAPEWFKNSGVRVKVDVYSYGIVLLELICCRRNFEAKVEEENEMILCDWVYDCYKDGKMDMVLVNDEEALGDMNRVERFVMVALWCIQENPLLRPTIKKVIHMLEGIIQISIPPNPSSFTNVN
ncbi:hypothetical protein F8388_005347 [Cannabis sativa]|uniref:Receptor-like serine/threonine-protein kinase n=1 Tax=Cannabis sativa TaxID=3483 RepID=A0A7J6ELA9_CANSA|nr:hypothetical protein F8388_005347 [Cannabis sativa]